MCRVDPAIGSCMACKPDSSDPTKPGVCVQAPLCIGLDNEYQNYTCGTKNKTFGCRPRDASAFLSKACNGLQECKLDNQRTPLDPSIFGPYPCNLTPTDIDYAALPVSPGWNGMNTPDPNTGKTHKGSFNQGYYVHGIYTCIVDDEIPTPN